MTHACVFCGSRSHHASDCGVVVPLGKVPSVMAVYRTECDAFKRRMSVAFATPARVELAHVLDTYALGRLTHGLYGEIAADCERANPRARRVLSWE